MNTGLSRGERNHNPEEMRLTDSGWHWTGYSQTSAPLGVFLTVFGFLVFAAL